MAKTLSKQYSVRPWDEKDTKKKWTPVYIGDLEELLQEVGTVTLTFETEERFIAWGGDPEEVCESVMEISAEQQSKEFAYLCCEGSLMVWSSVKAFIDSVSRNEDLREE